MSLKFKRSVSWVNDYVYVCIINLLIIRMSGEYMRTGADVEQLKIIVFIIIMETSYYR